jgi:hypothetical protein
VVAAIAMTSARVPRTFFIADLRSIVENSREIETEVGDQFRIGRRYSCERKAGI